MGIEKILAWNAGIQKILAWNAGIQKTRLEFEGLMSCLRMQVFPEKKSLETVLDEYYPDMYIYIYTDAFSSWEIMIYIMGLGFRVLEYIYARRFSRGEKQQSLRCPA